jgi:hypothetical protein
MLGLLSGASTVLSSLGGGGNPLGGITGEEGGPVTSAATSGAATTGTGAMQTGGQAETPWLLIGVGLVVALLLWGKR